MKEADIRPKKLHDEYLRLSMHDVELFFQDKSGFVTVSCPACGSRIQEPSFQKQGFQYCLCQECGTLYLSPRPTKEQLNVFYQKAESVKYWSTHFYKQTEKARRESMFAPRAKLVSQIMQQCNICADISLVDIGTGYGIFLEEMQKTGCCQNIFGVEPDREMAIICREKGFLITEKWVEDIKVDEIKVDVATAFEVLEHVFDPYEFLNATTNLLKKDGQLLLTTLTVSGFDIQVLWQHSKSIYPPHHINFLSISGIKKLFERAGYFIQEISTPGKLDVDIVKNILQQNSEINVSRFISSLVLSEDDKIKDGFQNFLSNNCMSSHLRILAKKKCEDLSQLEFK